MPLFYAMEHEGESIRCFHVFETKKLRDKWLAFKPLSPITKEGLKRTWERQCITCRQFERMSAHLATDIERRTKTVYHKRIPE